MWSLHLALKALLTFSLTADNTTEPARHELRRRDDGVNAVGYTPGQSNFAIPDTNIVLKYYPLGDSEVNIPSKLLLPACEDILDGVQSLIVQYGEDWRFKSERDEGTAEEKGKFKSHDVKIDFGLGAQGMTATLYEASTAIGGIKMAAMDPKYGYTEEASIRINDNAVDEATITLHCADGRDSRCPRRRTLIPGEPPLSFGNGEVNS